jgi:hypothetical protein
MVDDEAEDPVVVLETRDGGGGGATGRGTATGPNDGRFVLDLAPIVAGNSWT